MCDQAVGMVVASQWLGGNVGHQLLRVNVCEGVCMCLRLRRTQNKSICRYCRAFPVVFVVLVQPRAAAARSRLDAPCASNELHGTQALRGLLRRCSTVQWVCLVYGL